MRYAAFLRGINVSGQKLIKMEELRALFEKQGFKDVQTLLQSGNVVFESSERDSRKVEKKIEAALLGKLGKVRVFVRTLEQMRKIVKVNPFAGRTEEKHRYVVFLNDCPKLTLPLFSPKEDVECFGMAEGAVFCLSHAVKGKFGFPNGFLEAKLKVSATTRNWNTVVKVVTLLA